MFSIHMYVNSFNIERKIFMQNNIKFYGHLGGTTTNWKFFFVCNVCVIFLFAIELEFG